MSASGAVHLANADIDASLLRALIDALPEAVYFVDRQRRVHVWNKRAEQISGFTREQMEGGHCFDGYLDHIDETGAHLCHTHCPLHACMETGQAAHGTVYLHHREGYRVPVHIRAVPIYGKDGELIGALESFEDLSPGPSIMRHKPGYGHEQDVCPVTGVASRGYLEACLEERLDAYARAGIPFGMILLEPQDLAALAAKHGQPVADMFLRLQARTLQNDLGPSDCVGRWDKHVLAVIKPRVRPGQIEALAARLRLLALNTYPRDETDARVSAVSIGAATVQEHHTLDELIRHAERNLRQDWGRALPVEERPACRPLPFDRR